MPTKYVEYPLQDGFVGNRLVASPQIIPVDLSAFSDATHIAPVHAAGSAGAMGALLPPAATWRGGSSRIVRHFSDTVTLSLTIYGAVSVWAGGRRVFRVEHPGTEPGSGRAPPIRPATHRFPIQLKKSPRVKARPHAGDGGTYLWVANPTRKPIPVRLTLSEAWGGFSQARTLWGASAACGERAVELTALTRDVSVLELR